MEASPTTIASPRRARAFGALTLLCGGIAAIVASYSVHAGMRFNAVRLPYAEKLDVRIFLPQGWKFFTRDAREERSLPFLRATDGRWVDAGVGSNGDRGHLLGARRDSRAQNAELAGLVHEAEGATWTPCTASPTTCLNDDTAAPTVVVNTSSHATLCGSIAIVRQAPVPWAWARDGAATTMPSRVLRLEVQC